MKTNKRSSTAAERRQKAFELHLSGHTFQKIGDQFEISRQAAHGLVRRELDRLNKQTEGDADVLRQLELERLDVLVKTLWSKATSDAPDFAAIDKLLKISERRSRLLGLDSPARTVRDVHGSKVVIYLPANNRDDR